MSLKCSTRPESGLSHTRETGFGREEYLESISSEIIALTCDISFLFSFFFMAIGGRERVCGGLGGRPGGWLSVSGIYHVV